MNKKCLRIAFIDDGISSYAVPKTVNFTSYEIIAGCVVQTSHSVQNSHGTVCYNVFKSKVIVEYELISIKVLDELTRTGNAKELACALDFCAESNIDVINISVGASRFADFPCIAKSIENIKNSVIVAAGGNEQRLVLPACLPTVIGVSHNSLNLSSEEFAYRIAPFDGNNVYVNIEEIPVQQGINTKYINGINSMAAPVIAAKICGYLNDAFPFDNLDLTAFVLRKLMSDSVKNFSSNSFSFYRNFYSNWKEPNVPIIVLPDFFTESFSHEGLYDFTKKLLREFAKNDYAVICLSDSFEQKSSDLIFPMKNVLEPNAPLHDLIRVYFNFSEPSAIVLHINPYEAENFAKEKKLDLLLLPHGAKKMPNEIFESVIEFNAHDDAKELLRRIETV